jgi:hypothetical protein
VVLSLAALAIAFWWRERRVRTFGVLSLASLFFALGYQDVLYGIAYALVPMVEKAREPALAVTLCNFGTAILAAYGLDALLRREPSVWPRRIAIVSSLFGAGLLALTLSVFIVKGPGLDDRIVMVAILALLIAALLLAYQKQNLTAGALGLSCFLLMLIDLGNSSGYYLIHSLDKDHAIYLKQYSENGDILNWIRAQPGTFRVQVNRDEIPFNYGDWFGVEEFEGYVVSAPSRLLHLDQNDQRTRMLFGAKYWISKKPRDTDQVRVFSGSSGINVYQSPGALGRVWTVHQTKVVSAADQIVPAFRHPAFDARNTALFLGAGPQLETCSGADSAFVKSRFNRIEIQADMKCKGLVVLNNNYDSGWVATVDGQPARLWDAYTAIQGVEAGPGRHRIELRYRPWTVEAGAVLFVLSLLGLIAIAHYDPPTSPAPLAR